MLYYLFIFFPTLGLGLDPCPTNSHYSQSAAPDQHSFSGQSKHRLGHIHSSIHSFTRTLRCQEYSSLLLSLLFLSTGPDQASLFPSLCVACNHLIRLLKSSCQDCIYILYILCQAALSIHHVFALPCSALLCFLLTTLGATGTSSFLLKRELSPCRVGLAHCPWKAQPC